jgi:tetratricopeptide (TPR) repeat protein
MPKVTPKEVKKAKTTDVAAVTARHEPWTYQAAFWGLAILLFFPPYFRGLFFATEQQRVLILAAVLFWFVWLWKHNCRDYKFLSHPLDYFILALPVVYLISAFDAVNYGLAIDEAVKNILYFLVYWMIVQLVREEADISRLLHVVYLAAAGVALAGLATATGLVFIKDGFLNGRIYSSFQYPNALASYLAAAGFLGLFFWQKNGRLHLSATITDQTLKKLLPEWLLRLKPYGYFYAAVNFILLAVLFGTKSRGGLLVTGIVFVLYIIGLAWQKRLPALLHLFLAGGLGYLAIDKFIAAAQVKQMGVAWLWILLGLVVVGGVQLAYNFVLGRNLQPWVKERRKTNRALAGLAAVILAAGGVFVAIHPGWLQKMLSFNYLRNAFERFYFVQDALAMFKTRSVLGWGGGGWEEAYRSFQHYLYNSNEVHSYYFQVAVETGILGLLAVLGIWAAFLWAGYRAYRASLPDGDRRALVWTMLAAAVAIGGHALIDFDLSLSALTLALWTLFAGVRAAGGLPEAKRPLVENLAGAERSGQSGIKESKAPGGKKKKRRKDQSGTGKQPVSGSGKRNIKLPPSRPVLVGIFSAVSVLLFFLGMTLASAGIYARSASESLQSRNVEQSLLNMEKAVARNSLNADYHTGLMRIYLGTGRLEQATEEAGRAAELSRYSAARKADLASVYLYSGKYEQAVSHARRAVELAPYQVNWYEVLASTCAIAGRSELAGGKKDAARRYLEEALKTPALIQKRVAALSEEEKRLWKDGPMLSPTPGVHLYTGQAFYLLGKLPEAEKDLQNAAGDEQAKGEALVWLALVKEKQGKTQEAKELVNQASGINKTYGNAFEQLKTLPVL